MVKLVLFLYAPKKVKKEIFTSVFCVLVPISPFSFCLLWQREESLFKRILAQTVPEDLMFLINMCVYQVFTQFSLLWRQYEVFPTLCCMDTGCWSGCTKDALYWEKKDKNLSRRATENLHQLVQVIKDCLFAGVGNIKLYFIFQLENSCDEHMDRLGYRITNYSYTSKLNRAWECSWAICLGHWCCSNAGRVSTHLWMTSISSFLNKF